MKSKFAMIIAVLLLMDSVCCLINRADAESLSTRESLKDRPASALKSIVADHTSTVLERIPAEWVKKAREGLHIAYGHTSHGSQLVYGMMGLTYFKKEPFIYEKGTPEGSIDLRDNPFGGEKDLGNPDNRTWAEDTRKYLEKNRDVNVVIWSWCGQLSTADRAFVENYLELMQGLEKQFPGVTFVYMTGHLDGTGPEGTLAQNNKQIRDFCINEGKVLFDFADIESYDPDGRYYGDKYADDGCRYDSDGDKKPDKNWAQEWQNSHKKGVDWYECYAAHTGSVNANRKAYAMWWLLSRVAGWSGDAGTVPGKEESFTVYAEKLKSLNLFKGTENGYDLERVPTRLEGAAMLTRLLGGEQEALDRKYSHPFKDAAKTWGDPYVGYLQQYHLTKGISGDQFGCALNLDSNTYMTFLLRVLGYSDNGENSDFQWNKALEKARDLGIIQQDYFSVLKKESFNRGHMAKLTCFALTKKLNGKNDTLLEKLVNDGVIDKKAAEQF